MLVGISFITKTTHVVSFAFALVVVGLLSRSFTVRTVIIVAPLLGVLYWIVSNDAHYTSRVDVYNAGANLSLLSWLQGFDQMVTSIKRYPFVGAGLGGTGQFDFYSEYSDDLFRAGIGDLNRLDAFSGFFRLVIELGPVLMGLAIWALVRRFQELWRATGGGLLPQTPESKHQIFLFTFGFTLLAGVFLKEPTFSRSQFVVAPLLVLLVPLRSVLTLPVPQARRAAEAERKGVADPSAPQPSLTPA